MEFQLMTPQTTVFSADADLVGGRTREGSFSILSRHIPAIMELELAVLKVETEGRTELFVVQGGFLFKERDETVKVLTPEARKVEDVVPEEVETRIDELTGKLAGMDEESPAYKYVETQLNRAETELSVVEDEGN